jgi:hypothetical protein
MTKKAEQTETQTAEKNKLIGRLSYLPYGHSAAVAIRVGTLIDPHGAADM